MDLTLVLTHDCNLGCGYCYTGRKFKRSMPLSVARRALQLAFGTPGGRRPGFLEVAYFGGEPTLEWDLLVEASEIARELAREHGVTLVQSVTTNGTMLTSERVRTLGAHGIYVALSIDGTRRAHEENRPSMGGASTYDATSGALDLLVAEGRAFETNSVVTPASAPELGASVRELFMRGVPRVSTSPCYEAPWSDEAIAHFERGLTESAEVVTEWLRAGRTVSFSAFDAKIIARIKGGLVNADKCALGDGRVAVAPSGNIYPCERLVGEDADTRGVIGHVREGLRVGVATARTRMPDHHAVNDECDECAERSRCGAFCACANHAETGDVATAGGVQCWYERTSMRLADELADRMIAEENAAFLEWFFPSGPFAAPPPRTATANVVQRARRGLPVIG